MKFGTLLSLQPVLLINWVAFIGLPAWIAVRSGFASALGFSVLWLVLDRVRDFVTRLIMVGAEKVGTTEYQVPVDPAAREVSTLLALAMLIDFIATLLLPWVLAALFLGWFGA